MTAGLGAALAGAISAAVATFVAGCGHTSQTPPRSTTAATGQATAGPLTVLVEGLCPKLKVYAAGDKLFLVYGTYGLDAVPFAHGAKRGNEVGASQSFVELSATGAKRDSSLLAGLPTNEAGYIPGDIEMGGLGPEAMWLARIDTSRGSSLPGVLYERSRLLYGLGKSGWRLDPTAKDAATPGLLAPELPEEEICDEYGDGLHFASYAAERLPSGDVLVAGRCEDSLHRAKTGVRIASFVANQTSWSVVDTPDSPLFRSIVNVGVVFRMRREAYVYAYPPYASEEDATAYLVRYDGTAWIQESLPFEGPIVSLAATDDGTLWAITRWRLLWRRTAQGWERVALPEPVFVDPSPDRLRLLEVQAVGSALWVHGAYPIALEEGERAAARGHVLFTTRPVDEPLFCDRHRNAAKALTTDGSTLRGAELRR